MLPFLLGALICAMLMEFRMAMMECPRCRFMQPEDKFCANCGVDVESYSPGPDPIQQKLLPNTYVAAILAGGIIVAMVIFFMRQPGTEVDSDSTLTRDSEFSAQREAELAKQEQEYQQRRKAKQEARRAAQLEEEKKQEALQKIKNETQAELKAAEADLATPSMAITPSRLNVRFYEAVKSNLESTYSQGQLLSESSNVVFYKVPKSVITQATSGAKSLPGNKSEKMVDGSPVSLISSYTPEEGAVSWEFGLEVLPSSIKDDGYELSVSGGLFSTGIDALPASLEISPEIFQFANNEALFMVGFIPHAPIEDPESAGLSGSPLRIITSSDFQDFKTEFVMVVEPQ